MGSMAASGGYYVAMSADAIVANPGTITGSIGVFSGNWWFGISRIGSESRQIPCAPTPTPTPGQLTRPSRRSRRPIGRPRPICSDADFVERVAEGRNLTTEAVDAVARGRIWTGADALERGLVDELGGLRTAVRRAKVLAGLDEDSRRPHCQLSGLVAAGPAAATGVIATGGRVAAGCGGALLGRTVTGMLERVEQTLGGASVLWLGQSRF